MAFLGKKKSTTKSSDKIEFILLEDDDDKAKELADKIIDGTPIVVNFEKLDVQASNKMLAFLHGVTYALNGRYNRMDNYIFLFAKEEEFEDGSLIDFINNL